MQLKIYSLDNKETGKIDLPIQFTEAFRPDLIQKAVLALQANRRQKYGAHPQAGKRSSNRISKKRRDYRGSYGHGISRVPRKVMSRRGTHFNWTGAFAPGTVGGRRAHPPKAEKNWSVKLNDAEKRKALRSALAATLDLSLVKARQHNIPSTYPFIIEDAFEKADKTSAVQNVLLALGFKEELARTKSKTIRAGKGKMRGRKYKRKTGVLLVTADTCPLTKAGKNIPGIDVVNVAHLNTEQLAPGSAAGRATLFTKSAIEKIAKEKLFLQKPKKTKSASEEEAKPAQKKEAKPTPKRATKKQ